MDGRASPHELGLARAKQKVKQKVKETREHLLQLLLPNDEGDFSPIHLDKPQLFYKVVATVGEHFVSVFDGQTNYELGKWTHARMGAAAWPPLYSCMFAFNSPKQALEAKFPVFSALKNAPKVLVEIEAYGRSYMRQSSSVWALSKVRLRSVITRISSRVGQGEQQPPGKNDDLQAFTSPQRVEVGPLPRSFSSGSPRPNQSQELPWHFQLRSSGDIRPGTDATRPAFRPASRCVTPKPGKTDSNDDKRSINRSPRAYHNVEAVIREAIAGFGGELAAKGAQNQGRAPHPLSLRHEHLK